VDASDLVTSILATLALVVAAWSLWYSRRATVASERSAVAAERSAAAAEALVPSPPPPVSWRLEWESNDGYNLRNTGPKRATVVRIEGLPANSYPVRVRGSEPLTICSGEAVKVIISGTLQAPRATSLRVTCAELPEPSVVPVTR
jgi:hypothetical protein